MQTPEQHSPSPPQLTVSVGNWKNVGKGDCLHPLRVQSLSWSPAGSTAEADAIATIVAMTKVSFMT